MRNLHEIVIDNICKVVGWIPITFHEYLVINDTVVEAHLTVNNIFEFSLAIGHKHSNDIRLSIIHSFLNFTLTQIKAESVVFCSLVFFPSLF